MNPQLKTKVELQRLNTIGTNAAALLLAPLSKIALALGAATLAVTALASTPQMGSVGEVSLVLGKVHVRTEDGKRILVKLGTPIRVNDIIETGRNGHVHVRFVDEALVSVRPSSTLEVVRYDYNQENPAASEVKFNLVEGVTRAISGKAAQQARQNFRMNTPIAAIGVRGTDFVVSATSESVRALVNEGSIVVAPFSSDCSAETLGPCSQSQNALELVSGASQIIEINAGELKPELLSVPGTVIPESALEQSAPALAETGKNSEEEGDNEIYTDSVTNRAVSQKIEDTRQLANNPAPVPVPPVVETPPAEAPPPEVTPPPVVTLPPVVTPPVIIPEPEFTPDIVVPPEVLAKDTSQLVWGRWSEARLANERITVSYDDAFADGREATIGNNRYALFRLEDGSKEVDDGLGVLAFNLTQAQAILKSDTGQELMDVYGGLLNIDIEERRFSTSLELGHSATGRFVYSDSGLYFGGGIFRNRTDEKVTVGVLSIDGSEAGYFFETTVDAGRIEGLTLWSVQP